MNSLHKSPMRKDFKTSNQADPDSLIQFSHEVSVKLSREKADQVSNRLYAAAQRK
jgi:hypothetical protein